MFLFELNKVFSDLKQFWSIKFAKLLENFKIFYSISAFFYFFNIEVFLNWLWLASYCVINCIVLISFN